MRRSELRVQNSEAIEAFLNLFVYAEQHWCEWSKLEDAIAVVDYDDFSDEYQEWFIEFLANMVLRVWRSAKEGELNLVEESEDHSCFIIKNYDWNAFKFGKTKGLDQDVTTKTMICIDAEKLNDKEIKWLRSKIK